MRIRRRPPFSSTAPFASPPPPSPPLLRDPSLHLSPLAPNGRDATASNGGAAREGQGAQELHQDGRPPKDPHGAAQDPKRRTPLHPPPPPPPCLDPSGETKGRSIHCSTPTHPTHVGHRKVQDFVELPLPAAKSEEERGVSLDSKMSWDDAEQVNSNKRVNGSSGATILLEAARQLEAAAAAAATMAEKRKKRMGGCDDDHAGDYESDERLKEEVTEAKEEEGASGCGGAAASVRNNCTSVNGSDNDGHGKGDGPAAVMEEDKGGAVVVNGSGRSNGKKRRSPAVLMEGSRCSRVNGRGWRCCQQTLVGYSLCEHHLGKGRLRSMSSVRGQIGATTRPKKNPKTTAASSSSLAPDEDGKEKPTALQQQQQRDTAKDMVLEKGADTGEVENTVKKKRRKKMGMVKARSISSLLDGAVAADSALA